MTVYVDGLAQYSNNLWCHMASDDLTELHELAREIGLKQSWFQDHPRVPHYDLVSSKRRLAVAQGAVEVSSKVLFERCVLDMGLSR